jgi:hypothetical protein
VRLHWTLHNDSSLQIRETWGRRISSPRRWSLTSEQSAPLGRLVRLRKQTDPHMLHKSLKNVQQTLYCPLNTFSTISVRRTNCLKRVSIRITICTSHTSVGYQSGAMPDTICFPSMRTWPLLSETGQCCVRQFLYALNLRSALLAGHDRKGPTRRAERVECRRTVPLQSRQRSSLVDPLPY